MTTAPQTRRDLHAAMAAAGAPHFAGGYAGAVAKIGVAAGIAGGFLPALSGNLAPVSWHTSKWSRNLVALAVTPAA